MTSETYLVEIRKEKKTDSIGESNFFRMRKDRRYVIEYDKKVGHFLISECEQLKEQCNE